MSADILKLSRKQGRECAQANWSQTDVEAFAQLMQLPPNAEAELVAAFLEQKQLAA